MSNKLILSKIKFNLDELEDLIQERTNILNLNLEPSKNDTFEVISNLTNLVKNFNLVAKSLQPGDINNEFLSYINQYNTLYNKLDEDATIDVSEYKYEYRENEPQRNENINKTVRFKDEPSENIEPEVKNLFKPYKDDPVNEEDSIDNHQLFAQHQQTMMRQDEELSDLHTSINRQHLMSHDINQELDDHLIILNDLESGVDYSQSRLSIASTRLNNFRKLARENGSLFTIIILTIILILLLIVLN